MTGTADHDRALEERIGYRFEDRALLARALVHSSASERCGGDNERLEFLGDRVLGLAVAALLLERFPDAPEGGLNRRFTTLVRKEALADVAAEWQLEAHLVVGTGEPESPVEITPAILADAVEAVLAAVFQDGGFAAAAALVERFWASRIESARLAPHEPKAALQEWSQGLGLGLPSYRELERTGPPHAPCFVVEVRVERHRPARAEGRSKRAAEQAAATRLLERVQADDR